MQQETEALHLGGSMRGQQLDVDGAVRTPVATGGPVLSIDLAAAFRQLQYERRWSGNRNAITLVKHRDFRLVLTALKAGAQLSRHNVRGTVLIQVLSGQIRVAILDAVLEASAGEVISLDANLAHEVKAVEDSALLITIAWPESPAAGIRHNKTEDPSYDWRTDESVWN